jgi:hypothetical protein
MNANFLAAHCDSNRDISATIARACPGVNAPGSQGTFIAALALVNHAGIGLVRSGATVIILHQDRELSIAN